MAFRVTALLAHLFGTIAPKRKMADCGRASSCGCTSLCKTKCGVLAITSADKAA